MNSHEREPSRGGGGPERSSSSGGDGSPPTSGSATTNSSSGGGGGGASSAMAATTATSTMATKPTNTANKNSATTTNATNNPTVGSGGARSSSTESEGNARREYGGGDRRAPPSDDDEDDEDEEEEDGEEEEEEEEDANDSESSRSSHSGARSRASSGRLQPSHSSSSTSGSPVRRLPSMLRPPLQAQPQLQAQGAAYANAINSHECVTSPVAMYGAAPPMRQQQQQQAYYNSQVSPRDASTPTGQSGAQMDGRVLAQKRRLNQGGEYASPPLAPSGVPSSAATARALYEASQHHPSSNSSSSTARSGGGVSMGDSAMGSSAHHHRNTADDDDNEDPLRFETRGSHGPRDEARYETWTSKQLRKKCSHLKLRGLKNVKKHVMVEALYRYYRNQRGKLGGSDVANGSSARHQSGSASGSHSNGNGHSGGGARGTSSNRNDDGRAYSESYAQHRYEHSMNASSASSSQYMAGAAGSGMMRVSRPASSSAQSLSASLQPTARRSSPSSSTPPTRSIMRPSGSGHGSASGVGGVGGGSGSGYNSVVDLEESKYDVVDNEVRITSEDVIRLVDVILSPEFVDRLSSELSRWQFWVDVREKYISLVNMNGPSSYGAARGLTALGSDHHSASASQKGVGGGSAEGLRLPMASTYVRPSAKWSSMQLWEMWKELTFAYTKTCFEFTAAGVDERNYIQFCEGRPDVYYLHQRLHARPDLLHLIKSNEYIEEKCSSDAASEHTNMNAEKNAANALMGVGSPGNQRPHKRFKRLVPAGGGGGSGQGVGNGNGNGNGNNTGTGNGSSQAYGNAPAVANNYGGGSSGAAGSAMAGGAVAVSGSSSNAASADLAAVPQNASGNNGGRAPSNNVGGSGGGGGGGPAQYLSSNGMRAAANNSPTGQQEEGSTENSETTGEEGSLEKSNSNATSDSTRREALQEQKFFGLLLQNFEAIFESLHNKKVLLAALRKDNTAPDHLIADLHDDIHVLSALKKEFRNKLRQALE